MNIVQMFVSSLYMLWVGSAVLTFLAVYRAVLGTMRGSDNLPEAATRSVWLDLMYPPLFDGLSVGDLVAGFAAALPLSVAAWTIGAVCVVMSFASRLGR